MARDEKGRDSSRELAANVNLLRVADSGKLEAIECPECKESAVSVRFTHPAEGVYRTWFVCSRCEFRLRAQSSGRPANFAESLVDEKLQKCDIEMVRKMRRG